ncbi:MAG: NADH-quinone oxidoreductase subunit L [Thiobacillus sp.]|nr:NADH-quinone oxidoreductase subunit L [Thiobacillus sp.]
MTMDMQTLYLIVPLAPLLGAIAAGLFGKLIGRTGAHVVAIAGVAASLIASVLVFQDVLAGHTYNGTVYTWMVLGELRFEVGFLIDALTAMMMLVVTFVSLMVHIYTIGYMHDDPGYQRFFSYISLFTFSMLMLVMSNNFLQLFFGWEAVGLVSYLLIGFWYTKETAIYANLKAFLVNRVGDFGFILGIGLVLAYFGSLDYATVFAKAPSLAKETITLWPGTPWMLMTVIGILLFIGAMGKSAQFPLHVWLPDSMEGPTPISALIHAATMVTAGIFMVARMSPLFELSDVALSFIMVIGAITALFMGFLGIVQNDIKRVVAYSTLSQLGYMTVALGASAYSVAVFHLMTHAFFKALLFLAAGSVIIAMHHNQDIRYMGGLRKYMTITWITSLIGSLALIGTPFLSGFYSKETIIEAVKLSHLPGSGFAYVAVLLGVFVTAFYSFRMYFLVFHGKERFHQGHAHGNEPDAHHGHGGTPHENPWVVIGPLLALALPSLAIGYMTIEPMLFGDFFGSAIYVADRHPVMHELNQEFHGPWPMGLHAVMTLPFWLAAAGVGLAAFFYLKRPDIPAAIAQRFKFLHQMLLNKYWFDELYGWLFAKGARVLGGTLWRRGDQNVIDGFFINGTVYLVERASRLLKAFQSGYIYHYAFAMLIGVFALVTWFARLN